MIRMIAKDLYKIMRDIDRLEKKLTTSSLEEQDAVSKQLRILKKEREKLQNILESKKRK